MRRTVCAAALGAAGLVLVVAGPAAASTTAPPVASEPPGGATCAPGQPSNGCGQDAGSGSGSTASPAPTRTRSSSGSSGSPTSLPSTGTLPRTGRDDAGTTGLVGAGLLAAGAVLVVAARRRSA